MSKRINEEAGLIDPSILEDFKASLDSKLTEYDDQNIYNCDETGHVYKQSSRLTYIFSDENKANGKFSKERIQFYLLLAGQWRKLKSLIIGKSKTPRCFKNVDINSLLTYYYSNKKLYEHGNFYFLVKKYQRDDEGAKKKDFDSLNNAPVHTKNLLLTNVELSFFPANTTTKIQPLDQGIIKSFKDEYR
ncbi:Tigger transposable element-derived protein 4 [Nosema granulosis]|uniref:Tigger transposable element-derived protein 4 n=1 Tax=Nosema granulosis TaxID=83296 RepID=A0A9P6GXB1_9MICR|nr:Tigger transposable element-derived protein 4 [Nosema granulosis]